MILKKNILKMEIMVARVVMPNSEIPIGVITSAIGAPIFVYMMIKKSYGFGGGDR